MPTPPDGSGRRSPAPAPAPSASGQPSPGVGRRGRHAAPDRDDDAPHTPPEGYRPRHAAPDAATDQFAVSDAARSTGLGQDHVLAAGPGGAPTVVPGPGHREVEAYSDRRFGPPALDPRADADAATTRGLTPAPRPAADPRTDTPPQDALLDGATFDGATLEGADVDGAHSAERVRVVFAERRSPTRAVRTVAEIEQQTATGELLLDNLLRAQLTLAVRLGLVALLLFGALPVLFLVMPALGSFELLGIRVPWLLLGIAPYPFLVLLGWLYIRAAERNELDFADNVED